MIVGHIAPARVPYKGKQAAGPEIGRKSRKFEVPYKKEIKKQ